MKIVGPVRLRTIHTRETACPISSPLDVCYYSDMSNEQNLIKEDIDGVKF
jgi:hypothetical protein